MASPTLEKLLWHDIGEPLRLKLYQLQAITNNFSKDLIIGSGGFGVVYKGKVGRYFVAVKKLGLNGTIDDELFKQEVDCLMRIRHPNIIWFVGYCAETSMVVQRGREANLFADSPAKLLCFEYLRNGSLGRHLTEKAHELEWSIRYQILKGVCLGLHYLHEKQMIHLDLKPENILLDDDMVPKIADFGVARLLGQRSYIISEKQIGTRHYMAPEYRKGGKITVKSDIYSLGIIIWKILTVHDTGTTTDETSSNEKILDSWRRRQVVNPSHLKQIKECIEIAEICTEDEPEKRPAISDILRRLVETEAEELSLVATAQTVVGRAKTNTFTKFSFLSKLMDDMKQLAITSSQHPSTQVEGSDAPLPVQSQLLTSPDGPEESYMLPSRSLTITWIETPGHWKWITLPDSRFPECAELLSVYFLAVTAEIATKELSAGMRYTVYLVYKLATSTTGLKDVQTSSVRLYGERIIATNKVSVNPTSRRLAGVAYPASRDDGWMELQLAELTMDDHMLSENAVIVDFREENVAIKKSGLIIEGIEFRPNN